MGLRVSRLGYELPAPLSRPVVLPDGTGLVVAGGLTAASNTAAAVLRIDLSAGRIVADGSLAVPVHDAAGAVLGGRELVFGGGAATSVATVQALDAGVPSRLVGTLPEPRSDLVAAAMDGQAYLLGGYTGRAWLASVLATGDGTTFRTVATLPVPVRYPALVATPGALWVVGGETASGAQTGLIQRVTLPTGQASVVGRLAEPLAHAVGFALAGRVYVAGGLRGRSRTSAILAIDPTGATGHVVAQLPMALSDCGVATAGGVVYLVGGEAPRPVATVIEIQPGA